MVRPSVTAAFLEGSEVSKRFGGLRVLHHVSFRVSEGEIVALIGPNGAGKTTLFNLISGLTRPSAGTIRMGGHVTTALPAYRITRLGLGRTFQTPRPFLDLTVAENVAAAGLFSPRRAQPVSSLLALVELADHAHTLARHLPTGRRKLCELAMALALEPRVVLLDEILAGLTPTEVAWATTVLRRLRDERGIGLFWVEHVMQAVMETADRLIVLHHGEVIAEGPPAAVTRDERVLEAYLGHTNTP
jgi:branched-chain amino acid transport system ATP-binding protein